MAHNFTNFNTENKKKIKSIVVEATRILALADNDLAGKRPGHYDFFKTWFGIVKNDEFGQVRAVITKMYNALYTSTINLTYNDMGTCDGNTFAEALAPDKPESYKKIEDAPDHDMVICPEFFNLNRFEPQNPGDDTQMETFLHELSHLVGGTNDEPHPTEVGKEAYGSATAMQLAQTNPESARNNADNYGFYCMDMARLLSY